MKRLTISTLSYQRQVASFDVVSCSLYDGEMKETAISVIWRDLYTQPGNIPENPPLHDSPASNRIEKSA